MNCAGVLTEEDIARMARNLIAVVEAADALAAVVEPGLRAPSGCEICHCRNRNAVKAGIETACWYCQVGDAARRYREARR